MNNARGANNVPDGYLSSDFKTATVGKKEGSDEKITGKMTNKGFF
jgi:hypothetical protein